MTSLISKAREKVRGSISGASSGKDSDGTDDSPSRSIPPEPIQQLQHGDFAEQDADPALQVHNLARANKGCSGLRWSKDLARDAEEYAKKLAAIKKTQHSGARGQGENLYVSSDGEVPLEDAVNSWLAEGKLYHGEKIGEGDLAAYGHYTQCMWSASTHVGMGRAVSDDGTAYIVARYTPQGNMEGQTPYIR